MRPDRLDGISYRWSNNEPVSVTEASLLLGIPRSTLRDRLLGARCGLVQRQRYYLPATIRERALGGVPHQDSHAHR